MQLYTLNQHIRSEYFSIALQQTETLECCSRAISLRHAPVLQNSTLQMFCGPLGHGLKVHGSISTHLSLIYFWWVPHSHVCLPYVPSSTHFMSLGLQVSLSVPQTGMSKPHIFIIALIRKPRNSHVQLLCFKLRSYPSMHSHLNEVSVRTHFSKRVQLWPWPSPLQTSTPKKEID